MTETELYTVLNDWTMYKEDIIEWIQQHPKIDTKTLVRCLVDHGSVSVLEFVDTQRKIDSTCIEECMEISAEHGDIQTFKWLCKHKNAKSIHTNCMDKAAENGHLEMVEYIYLNNGTCTTYAMDKAAENGHIGVVEFLHNNDIGGCTVYAIDGAAANGCVYVIEFLYKNRKEGCTTNALIQASKNGYVDAVKFLYIHYKWTNSDIQDAMNCAASSGYINIVSMLYKYSGVYIKNPIHRIDNFMLNKKLIRL
jgi:hypothetical protein